MKSLLLDRTTWDLVVDDKGNLAICTEPYATLQDVSTAVMTWAGECWYDTTLGLSYKDDILQRPDGAALMRVQAEHEALKVPGVVSAQCVILNNRDKRRLTGNIIVMLESGVIENVRF